ncbi:MAG: DUF255 domain-containing protein [Candidatus Eremiobacteraeota bacterium]|nr:DUF255 domain-containing protein [Candidatus Eremiobacteraeota bacterium]
MNDTHFHFSPRTNRANEIRWNEWSGEAFDRARAENKPVLLGISAVWCHWCHVMDETTYSQPEVIAFINERFIAIRVDNDRRPDINARYNQGGWPTTAFLTPEGVMLAGATYVPPAQMLSMLAQVERYFNEHREHIAAEAAALSGTVEPREELAHPLLETAIARVAEDITDRYDEQYGGFGSEPKFPMTDALEFLLFEYRVGGDERLYKIVARSMLGMSRGGMYDHVEGGFYRYSTTRDWSIPHFEKMTEDHGGLLRVLAQLFATSANPDFRTTLVSASRYVRTVLFDAETLRFAGSQDADEAYFALPLEERRAREAPYVDRTSYSNWSAPMIGALFATAMALDDDALTAQMCAALDTLHEDMLDADGLLYHFIQPHGAPQVRGLLCDQSAYLRALIDAHEFSGEPRFLERARALSDRIVHTFSAPDGGFYDRAPIEDTLGALARQDRPLADNASIADSFLRLSLLFEASQFRDIAERTLRLYQNTYPRAAIFAAPYARALRRFFGGSRTIVIVGSPSKSADLREAAHALDDPLAAIRTIASDDAESLAERGLESTGVSLAYPCSGRTCGPPADTPAKLAAAYETLTHRPGI